MSMNWIIGLILAINVAFASGTITKKQLSEFVDFAAKVQENRGLRDIVQKHSDAVVLIYSISNLAEDDGRIYNSTVKKRLKKHHYKYGVTSGVMLSQGGIICTTYSGIMNADEFIVSVRSELRSLSQEAKITFGENDYKAKVVKVIPELNLAFFKIDPKRGEKFHFVEFGNDSNLAKQSDNVLFNGAVVIGKAKGERFVSEANPANSTNNYSMTSSGIEKLSYSKVDGLPRLIAENFVSGTGIIPENEGGAILDEEGKLFGIPCINYDDFSVLHTTAIPVSVIKQAAKIAVPSIIPAAEECRLGLRVVPAGDSVLENLAKTLGVVGKTGVKVESVELNSVAEKSGVISGDVILQVDGEDVTSPETYYNVEKYSFGKSVVALKILRNNKLLDIEILR